MQLIQSNDRANRLSFKGALQHKVEAALSAPAPKTISPPQVLLLPTNFEDLNETDLHFSLMNNKELKHSRESANLAVEVVFGKRIHPKNVTFQTIELSNPVHIPQFAKKESKRSPARPLTAPDSTAVRMQAEKDKEAEFKAYIETLSNRTRTDQATLSALHPVVLRVPKNYDEFSESELFYTLTHTTELEHSRNSAYLAMDILSGKIVKPTNVTLQSIMLPRVVPTKISPVKTKEVIPNHVIEAERDKREQFKAKLADKASIVPGKIDLNFSIPEFIELRLPSHYEELSEAGLFYTLTHNPELQHSHDSALLAVEILFNKIEKPESVQFQTVDLTKIETKPVVLTVKSSDPLEGFIPEREMSKRAELKRYLADQTERILASGVPEEEPITLFVPNNYEELSQDELLYVLMNSTELAHNRASAYRTMDMLSGKLIKPANVTLQAKVLTKPVAEPKIKLTPAKKIIPGIHPDLKANEDAKYEAYLAQQAENPTPLVLPEKGLVLQIPYNYSEMSNAELLATITQNLDYGHTHYTAYLALDILSGRVKKPSNVILKAVKFAEKAEEVVTASVKDKDTLPDIVIERERFKREAFKAYLAGKAARTASVPVENTTKVTLRVPSNYAELNSIELLYVLMNNVELAQTRHSAYTTIDILSGVIEKPENVTLQAVHLNTPAPAPAIQLQPVKTPSLSLHPEVKAADKPKRQLYKQELADRANKALSSKPVIEEEKPHKIILLPAGYETMSDGELHFALVRNPELHHSQESARYAVDVLSGKIKNAPVEFKTIELATPVLAPVFAKPAPKTKPITAATVSKLTINRPSLLTRDQIPLGDSGEKVIKIPHNYEDMSETQLHFALSHNKEYGHSYESVYEALDILYGRTQCPDETVFSTVEVKNPVERAY